MVAKLTKLACCALYVVKISNSQVGNFKLCIKSFIMHRSIIPWPSLARASNSELIFVGHTVMVVHASGLTGGRGRPGQHYEECTLNRTNMKQLVSVSGTRKFGTQRNRISYIYFANKRPRMSKFHYNPQCF